MMTWLLLPLAYLLGSLSPAWLAGQWKGIDLRQHGSCNLGATNAGRVLGGRWFVVVFAADVLKGLLPVLAAVYLAAHHGGDPTWLPLLSAVATVLGHVFTCFHGFKGGKAVATSLGVLIGLVPVVSGLTFAIWLLCWLAGWLVFRLPRAGAVGPASVIAALAVPALHLALQPAPWSATALPLTIFLVLLCLLVVVRHRRNIAQLLGRPAPVAPSA